MNSLDALTLRVANALPSLSFKERETLKLRFGLGDGYCYTTAEIGRIWQKDARHARDVLRRALRKLEQVDPTLTKDAVRVLHAAGCTVSEFPRPGA